jgi:class 3 adenylate cyclase/tetratricopeptide (TPR) repeat protein
MTGSGVPEGNVTFLFTDMCGSTRIADALGDAHFESLVKTPHRALLRKAVQEHHGCLLQDTGDGIFAAFHTPQQGLAAAVTIQRGLRDNPIRVLIHDEKKGLAENKTIALRIGLHRSEHHLVPTLHGETLEYQDAYGEIAYARRVMDACCDAQILVSDALWHSIEGDKADPVPWKTWPNRGLKSFDEQARTLHEFLWDGVSKGEPGSRWLPNWYLRELNTYIARDAEMVRIRGWLEEAKRPLLTLLGFGGIGKTRLAVETVLQMGSHFPGGIAFLALDRETAGSHPEAVTPDLLNRALRDALSIPPEQANTTEGIHSWLRDRVQKKGRILLVHDNWESAQNEATLGWLGDLYSVLPDVYGLLTSRVLPGLTNVGEVYTIPFMQTPQAESEPFETYESGMLFLERVRQRADGWGVTSDNRPFLFRILKTLQGLPLGIELVAAHVVRWPGLAEIAEGLEQSLLAVQQTRKGEHRADVQHASTDPLHAEAGRHESLDASLNWSVERLSTESQGAFPRVGIFPVDFSAQMAKSVADIEAEWLTEWQSASLLLLTTLFGRNRYELLPVVQEYCLERLGGSRREYERRYFDWCLNMAKGYEAPGIAEKMAFIAEYRNLHAAATTLLHSTANREDAARLVVFGNALSRVTIGDRDANLRIAIACYEAALRVRTEQAFPQDWAMTQNNLGAAYSELPSGDRDANLSSAIACYEAALRVRTEQAFPQDWAMTQNNLGIVYRYLPSGDRAANLRRAIACLEAALRVRTEQAFPQEWATTQNNLGAAYSDLPSGDRDANLSSAIACYEAALRVRTLQAFPQQWAITQNNLGNAYSELPSGDRDANLRKAIACYEAALRVRTEQAFPQDWATTQNNLGNAYLNLPSGDRDANLRIAIACYEAALRVRTLQAFPQQWAITQNNLGLAYSDLPSGDRDANLRKAIDCFEAALRVRTEQAFPYEWAMTQFNLALAREEIGDREGARQAMQQAADGYRHVGIEREAQEAEAWLRQHGAMQQDFGGLLARLRCWLRRS